VSDVTDVAELAALDFESWVCPVPLRETPSIVMGHGGGGAMSGELI
jgi:hydrogenase expression/formation protein HypE